MKFFSVNSVRVRLGETLVTFLSLVRNTKRLAGNVIIRQTLVDAGADDAGVGKEKRTDVKVRMKRMEDLKMGGPGPASHPKALWRLRTQDG